MGQAYVGEIRMFGGAFAPAGWKFCSGQILPISNYDVLFNLIGTTYGGDGQSTFQLPDLRGRVPVHNGTLSGGSTYIAGQLSGNESITLTTNQIPSHNHGLFAATSGQTLAPTANTVPASATSSQAGVEIYVTLPQAPVNFNSLSITITGGAQPHSNVQPFLCVSFIMSMFGIFPSPT